MTSTPRKKFDLTKLIPLAPESDLGELSNLENESDTISSYLASSYGNYVTHDTTNFGRRHQAPVEPGQKFKTAKAEARREEGHWNQLF